MEAFTSSDLEKKGGFPPGGPQVPNIIFTWRPQPKATHSFPPNKESSSTAGQLFHPPLFAPLVLEPNLTNKTFLILNSIKEGILQYLTICDKELTWITLIGRPVSFASVSRICLVGFGVCKRHHENQRPAIKKRESIQKSNFCINSTHKQIVSCLFAWSLTKDSGFPIANAKLMVLTWSKANLRISSCLALIVVRGPRRFVPPGPSSPL